MRREEAGTRPGRAGRAARAARAARALALLAVVAVGVGGSGCGREPAFEDHTARVTVDGETTTFVLDGCLLDGTTFVMAGHGDDGQVLQATVGVESDGTTGVPASTGLTVTDASGSDTGAFGAEAWARRQGEGAPPGTIASARIRGARVQAAGRLQRLDVDGGVLDGPQVPFSLDSRCDEPAD